MRNVSHSFAVRKFRISLDTLRIGTKVKWRTELKMSGFGAIRRFVRKLFDPVLVPFNKGHMPCTSATAIRWFAQSSAHLHGYSKS